jgi:hypothetical protein
LFAPFVCWLLFWGADKAITTNDGVVIIAVMAAMLLAALSLLQWQCMTMEVLPLP